MYTVYGTKTFDCAEYTSIAELPFRGQAASFIMRHKLQYHHFFVVGPGACFSYFPYLGPHAKGDCCWMLEIKKVDPEHCYSRLNGGRP